MMAFYHEPPRREIEARIHGFLTPLNALKAYVLMMVCRALMLASIAGAYGLTALVAFALAASSVPGLTFGDNTTYVAFAIGALLGMAGCLERIAEYAPRAGIGRRREDRAEEGRLPG